MQTVNHNLHQLGYLAFSVGMEGVEIRAGLFAFDRPLKIGHEIVPHLVRYPQWLALVNELGNRDSKKL
jgi:hypothetical protein